MLLLGYNVILVAIISSVSLTFFGITSDLCLNLIKFLGVGPIFGNW